MEIIGQSYIQVSIQAQGGIEEPMPTIEESIPQCFDEEGNFLEEKCGKIIVVWNEEGLINYLIEKEIDNVIDEFENKSIQDTIDESIWTVDEGEWVIEEKGLEISNKAREIKQEMNEIKNQIVERTFASGTYDTGDDGNMIDNDVAPGPQGIVGKIDSSDAVDGSGGEKNEIVGGGGEGDYAEGTTAKGVDTGETTEGTDDVAPAVDSNEGSSEESAPVTGEVVGSENKESFLGKILDKIF